MGSGWSGQGPCHRFPKLQSCPQVRSMEVGPVDGSADASAWVTSEKRQRASALAAVEGFEHWSRIESLPGPSRNRGDGVALRHLQAQRRTLSSVLSQHAPLRVILPSERSVFACAPPVSAPMPVLSAWMRMLAS